MEEKAMMEGEKTSLLVLICFFVEYIVENVSLSFVRVGNTLGELLVLGMNSSGTCISY